MKKRDKIHCFVDRLKFIFKLIKNLNLSLLIICLLLCILNVILPYITMINTQEIINRIQIGLSINLILKINSFFSSRCDIHNLFKFI